MQKFEIGSAIIDFFTIKKQSVRTLARAVVLPSTLDTNVSDL